MLSTIMENLKSIRISNRPDSRKLALVHLSEYLSRAVSDLLPSSVATKKLSKDIKWNAT